MGVDCALSAERRRPDVAFVMVGLSGSEPYRSTLRRRYPRLRWPATKLTRPEGLREFIQANPTARVFSDVPPPEGSGLGVQGSGPGGLRPAPSPVPRLPSPVLPPHPYIAILPHSAHGLLYELHAGPAPDPAVVARGNAALWASYDLRGADAKLYPVRSVSRLLVQWGYEAARRRSGAPARETAVRRSPG